MTRWQELEQQRRVIRERLKGAVLHRHPTRGWMYKLLDNTFITEADYKHLRRQAGIWWTI
jgi:hypothetical protein